MKVCLAQIEVIPNQPDRNVRRMLEVISNAKSKSIDLVVFPEMCIGGYFLGDKWQETNHCTSMMTYNDQLRDASDGLAIAYGNIFIDTKFDWSSRKQAEYHPNKDGRARKYNAVYVFQDGRPAPRKKETAILPPGVEPKTLLPNYRIFDDERYFFSTQDVAKDYGVPLETLLQPFIIDAAGTKVLVGFELCEDMWCEDYRRNGRAINTTEILIDNGAELIMNLSASPWTFGKNETRDRRVKFLKSESGRRFVPFFYVNCVGVQSNGKDLALFDGGTTVYNADGFPVALASSTYDEEITTLDSDNLPAKVLRRVGTPKIEQQFTGIIRGIRYMNDVLGRVPTYVVGLSGGVDSAVVTSLLTIAVGKQNVVGVNMPTKYNQQATKDSARHLAEALGIKYLVIPIGELVELSRNTISEGAAQRALSPTLEQNIQAKVRNQILSNLAESYSGLYTCNGNKWEMATGYVTLDGDARGALAPIADLTKQEIFKMASYLNENIFKSEVIPQSVIDLTVKPGAELASDQLNPLKLGYHCALIEALMDFRASSAEDVMSWYLHGSLETNLGVTIDDIKRNGLDRPEEFIRDMDWFSSQLQRSVFKRIQCPPIIMLTRTAYGYDRRESILPFNEFPLYKSLKARILAMKRYEPVSELTSEAMSS